jgi:hypothetical protein
MVLASFAEFRMARRCLACKYEVQTIPPRLNKRLIYLDQWVISHIANALDPVLREKKGAKVEPFWLELYRQIERLVKLQVVVCPESPLHYRESVVTPYLTVLRALYEHLASGVRFNEPLQIHAAQLFRTFTRVVRGHQITDDAVGGPNPAVRGPLNEWPDDIRIAARFPLRQEEVAAVQANRITADQNLGRDSETWRKKPGRPFSEWYDEHRRDLTDVFLTCLDRNIFGTYWLACRSMIGRLAADGLSEEAAVNRVRDFLRSDAASEVPYCEISALLYAGMAKKIADEGQKKPAGHGHFLDINAIAAYLPYCDGICVDGYFAELLRKPDVASRLRKYRARVFSPNQRDEFLAYLRDLEGQVPAELRDTVLAVYGSNWLKPYDTILEYERRKMEGEP